MVSQESGPPPEVHTGGWVWSGSGGSLESVYGRSRADPEWSLQRVQRRFAVSPEWVHSGYRVNLQWV